MKKIIRPILFVLIFCCNNFLLIAQYTDTAKAIVAGKDSTLRPSGNRNLPPAKKIFPYKSYLLPATFIVYGIVSMHTDALQDVNETVKEEIYTEGSHKSAFVRQKTDRKKSRRRITASDGFALMIKIQHYHQFSQQAPLFETVRRIAAKYSELLKSFY